MDAWLDRSIDGWQASPWPWPLHGAEQSRERVHPHDDWRRPGFTALPPLRAVPLSADRQEPAIQTSS
jgi:hypothetical protein